MEFFATNGMVSQMEAALAAGPDERHIHIMLELAWQLRQRDTQRALLLANEVQNLLSDRDLSALEQQSIALRVLLIQAEAKWLFNELETCKLLAERALQGFIAIDDALGCADAHCLLAALASDKGDVATELIELAAMAQCAAKHDPVRVIIAQASRARFDTLRDVASAKQQWEAHFSNVPMSELHPAAACLVDDFQGIAASLSSDFATAVKHWSNAYTLALATGQYRRAVIATACIADAFKNLNEFLLPQEWTKRGLDLARQGNWPNIVGVTLMQMGDTMRRLQRLEAAHDILHEALDLMKGINFSRSYAIGLHYLGDTELDSKLYHSALGTFQLLEQRALTLKQSDLRCRALIGQAHALLQLEQPQAALEAAKMVHTDIQSNTRYRIAALRAMAKIYVRHPLPAPPGMNAASTPLHYLQQALDLAATIEGYTIPGDLWDALAQEYANVGDWQQAFHSAREASRAREKIHNQEAHNRANAMQIDRQTEQARSEAIHMRQLAATEAKRAEELQKNGETLAHLGTIGREITACLDASLVFQVLNRHVHHLLDVKGFIILLVNADGTALNLAFGIEEGIPKQALQIALTNLNSNAVRSVREKREIMVEYHKPPTQTTIPQEDASALPPSFASSNPLSSLFSPLWLGEKIIGVMSVQSTNPHAYGQREQFVFRTLCAYAAIALANAEALQALREAQAQLMQQEKMVSLGGLVNNFAHEINTPIAAVKSSNKIISDALHDVLHYLPQLFQTLNTAEQVMFISLIDCGKQHRTVLSSRQERALAHRIKQSLDAEKIPNAHQKASILAQLRSSELITSLLPLLKHPQCDAILAAAHQFALIDGNALNIDTATNRVSRIIAELKSFSGTEQSDKKVAAHLQEGIEATLAQYQRQMQNKVVVVRDYATIPALHCVLHEINQVWDNLIHNALQAMAYEGTLGICIRHENGAAVVTVQDTGPGIDESVRERIFDAFFSTKNAGEGGGLGLAIVKKIVERHQGRIEFEAVAGGGTMFRVVLPYEQE